MKIFMDFKCLEDYDPAINKRTIHFGDHMNVLIPFKRSESGIPEWWHAYNDVKHEELKRYHRGNLENSLTALAALKLLHFSLTQYETSRIFVDMGIPYDEYGNLTVKLLFSNLCEK